jgi:hypothetical protein
MAEHWNRTVWPYPRDSEPMAGIAAWFEVNWRIVRFSQTLLPECYMRVRAEDVLNEGPAQLAAIAAWLGLRTDPATIEAMTHPEASPFARPGPSGSGIVGGNDVQFLANPIPHKVDAPALLDMPNGWRGNRFLWDAVVDLAQYLGYPAAA